MLWSVLGGGCRIEIIIIFFPAISQLGHKCPDIIWMQHREVTPFIEIISEANSARSAFICETQRISA